MVHALTRQTPLRKPQSQDTYPPQRQPPRPRQLASEHAYILDGLSQRGLLVGAKQAPPYRADLVDERHGRREHRQPSRCCVSPGELSLRCVYPSRESAKKWCMAPLACRGNPKKRCTRGASLFSKCPVLTVQEPARVCRRGCAPRWNDELARHGTHVWVTAAEGPLSLSARRRWETIEVFCFSLRRRRETNY